MNWEHLKAVLWLRWRLSVNQWRRGGAVNAALMIIVAIALVVMAVPLFLTCLALGMYLFPKAESAHLMYAWDGMVLGFVTFWSVGLLTELQRTESLSLAKFLHLPISVNAAFLINYLSSLVRLSLVFFVPIMAGFGLAAAIAKGPLLLCALPLTAAFFLMVTALTYQFQGWLALLMSNPRRRRTIIVVTTAVFVMIFQVPNLLNMWGVWRPKERGNQAEALAEEMAALDRAVNSGEIDPRERLRRNDELLEKNKLAIEQGQQAFAEQWERTATWINLAIPLGWLPLGVKAAAQGNAFPAILGCLGFTLIGSASLWRAYHTTIALYQGGASVRKPRTAVAAPAPTKVARASGLLLLERRLPGFSEPVAAIALGGLKSLLRAPESKLMLMTPLLLGAAFGSMIFKLSNSTSDSIRALVGVAAIGLGLFGSLSLVANQFGFDRDGFRVFVLSSVPRRDILLGKNMSFAPLALAMSVLLLVIVEVVCPMRWDHLLSMAPQFISMYLLFCALMNLPSIYAPMHIAAGTMKPSNQKLLPVLLQLAMTMLFLPLIQVPTLLPLGIEALLERQGWTGGVPIALLLSLALCAGVVFFYHFALKWEGYLFQTREQRILEVVTNRAQ